MTHEKVTGGTDGTAERGSNNRSKITVREPQKTLTLIRQVALTDDPNAPRATERDLGFAVNDLGYAPISGSCVLLKEDEARTKIAIIGHFEKQNYGLSITISSTEEIKGLSIAEGRDKNDAINRGIVERLTDKYHLQYEEQTDARFITTRKGYRLAVNGINTRRSTGLDSAFFDSRFAFSSTKVRQKTTTGYGEELVDFDEGGMNINAGTIQSYFDDVAEVYDDVRAVYAENGIVIPPIQKDIISRPKKETTHTDEIRAKLGDIAENFAVKDPKRGFANIVGHDAILQELLPVITALTDPDAKRELLRSPAGVLLYGNPGCGKTLIAEVLANEAGCKFLSIKPSALFDVPWAKDLINGLFHEIAEMDEPVMIFVDEAETFFRDRAMQSQHRAEIVSSFLGGLDGLETRNNKAFLVCATNRPDLMDQAMIRSGRIDYQLEVKPPTLNDRKNLVRYFAGQVGTPSVETGVDSNLFDSEVLDEITLKEFAACTNDVVHADVERIINDALLQRRMKEGKPPVTSEDLISAAKRFTDNRRDFTL